MAAEIEQNFKVKAKLTEGSRGIFDVLKDGEIIFSKSKVDRFPDDGEISQLLKK